MTDTFDATVAVTGMNATDNPAPGVAVCRSLRAADHFRGRLIGLGYDALDPGFYAEGLLDGGAILPYPSAGRDALVRRLAELQEHFGVDVLLPTLDSELRIVAAAATELGDMGIATFAPRTESLDAASKAALPELGREHGIRVPESEAITTAEPIGRLVDRFGLPLVIKGVWYGARVCHSEADAISAFHHYVASWGLPVIVQRYIEGEEYDVAALGDGEGGTIGAVPMRKMALTDKGKAWSAVTISDPALLDTTAEVIAALRWRGGLEVECLREESTGDLYVAEINPRFPAWVYLATGAGQNLPAACVELALGRTVAPLEPYRVGTQFVRISIDQVSDLSTYGALRASGRFEPKPSAGS
ncbi:MAG: ATP-grasp domain-containing protein [Deltaproteobacteria bacterium]|jgi:carbamoyl-phosphate synthase large subunit|nr:ATP-grasp domain-containing protein [Deltaproteobacteria bacterium]MBW2533569.1 ATP-grasp domain-containing protein [Deltaproteobacteria bacterium]